MLLAGISAARAGVVDTQTTTTTYQYNADGALTAVTTQVGGSTPSTVYLSWDDFTPNVSDPTTGTVLAGNGNLIGIGPSTASPFTTQFQYDPRNRLTAAAATQSVAYTYYPASLMASSTLGGGDALQFYYGVSTLPQMTNISQPSTASWSSYLGDATYLSDGTEQVRCQPRKDVAGVFDPATQSFSPNLYDPYGTLVSPSPATADASTYDLQQNPFQFAGEYQDPTWGGYYLRARWYLDAFQTFLQRDPGDALHRYSYAGGNPVGNVDPSGLRFTYGQFSRDVDNFLRPVNHGALGEFLPLVPVYGQVVGGIQLIGNLPAVWHHPDLRTDVSFAFLAASVVAEAGDALPAIDRAAGPLRAFGARIGTDLGIGVGQTAIASVRAHGKLDVPALIQSISYNASGVLWGRLVAGFGYRSHPLSSQDVENMFSDHVYGPNRDEALVFKVRQPFGSPGSGASGSLAGSQIDSTLPALDLKRVGMFHEALVAVSYRRVWFTEAGGDENGNMGIMTAWNRFRVNNVDDISPTEFMEEIQDKETPSRFQYVGRFNQDRVEAALMKPIEQRYQPSYRNAWSGQLATPMNYHPFSNNCQDYVASILKTLRTP